MKINKIFLLSIFLLFAFFFVAPKAYASILFQDNFDSGNDNQWTRLSGGSLWRVEGGKYGARITSGSTIIETVAGDENWTDYSFEYDMLGVDGVDKNIMLRWTQATGFCNQFHFIGNNVTTNRGPTVYFPMENGIWHHIKVIQQGAHNQLYVDNVLAMDTVDPSPPCIHGKIGLLVSTGAVAPTEVWFDNIIVKTLDDNTVYLNVPLLKQTNPLWGSQIYDSADKWSSPHPGISSWGCAMTSAAMIFKFYGINKLPDGTTFDPGTLNSWLKTQPDGYVRNGWLNWLALSRMSKLAKAQNPEFSYDALEYNRKNGFDTTVLTNDLKNSHPDILEEPGHFIVGKGIASDVFTINDPYYDRINLTSYSNSFLSLGRYTPSNTDLSYVMFVVDSNIDIVLKDAGGNPLGESFVQAPINNVEFGGNSGNSLKLLYFKAPPGGDYKIFLSSGNNSLYKLEEYLYDQDGNVYLKTIDGVIEKGKTDNVLVHFDKIINTGSQSNPEATFDTVLSDLNAFYNLGLIKKGFYKEFYREVSLAKKLDKKHPKDVKEILEEIKEELDEVKKEHRKFIKIEVINILITDINSLLAKY